MFSTLSQESYYSDIGVADIIRFGRVNFKVSALVSKEHLQPGTIGGYFLYEKNRAPEFEYHEEPEIISEEIAQDEPFDNGSG